MIYINENTDKIIIPRRSTFVGSTYTLVLSSHLTNDFVLVDNDVNYSSNSLFYEFHLTEPINLYVGEYEYVLYSTNSEVVERGLLVYGNYDKCDVVVNETKKEKIQYEK